MRGSHVALFPLLDGTSLLLHLQGLDLVAFMTNSFIQKLLPKYDTRVKGSPRLKASDIPVQTISLDSALVQDAKQGLKQGVYTFALWNPFQAAFVSAHHKDLQVLGEHLPVVRVCPNRRLGGSGVFLSRRISSVGDDDSAYT